MKQTGPAIDGNENPVSAGATSDRARKLSVKESEALAEALKVMLNGFDRLFNTPFPYCSGWHTAPRGQAAHWQLHAHYYPPLLRSADVAKIPASYELLANLQRDLTPETAAANLRHVL